MTAQERFEEASRQFMEALQGAWAQVDVQQRGEYAQIQYMQALQEASFSEVQQRVIQAYANYMQVVQEALQSRDIKERATEAYREYVRVVRDAWLEVDVDSMDAPLLAAISQSMLSAAWVAVMADGGATPSGTPGFAV